jgi:hypothetical protein
MRGGLPCLAGRREAPLQLLDEVAVGGCQAPFVREAAGDLERRRPVRGGLGLLVGHLLQQIGEPPMRHDQVALPAGVARVGGRQPLADTLGFAVGRQRPRGICCINRRPYRM